MGFLVRRGFLGDTDALPAPGCHVITGKVGLVVAWPPSCWCQHAQEGLRGRLAAYRAGALRLPSEAVANSLVPFDKPSPIQRRLETLRVTSQPTARLPKVSCRTTRLFRRGPVRREAAAAAKVMRADETKEFISKGRLDALTDGVFAFAMTLLVVKVDLPEDFHPTSAAELIPALIGLGGRSSPTSSPSWCSQPSGSGARAPWRGRKRRAALTLGQCSSTCSSSPSCPSR